MLHLVRRIDEVRGLSHSAWAARLAGARAVPTRDSGPERGVDAALGWLARAQGRQATADRA